ncbi:MAG TPA: alpha/beta hydrolase [Acidimicrobiales bacterium]|nr:alpha/beta hydrolase [Acidimicrobiales bacterium]
MADVAAGRRQWLTGIAGVRRSFLFVALVATVAVTLPALGGRHDASAALPVKEVRYGALTSQVAYIYESASAGSPLVVLVHGGGFTGGSALSQSVVAEATWLQDHGVTVVDVNYGLLAASEGSLASEVYDVVTAARWAESHGERYGANTLDLTLIGGSAGGTLVALAASSVHPRHVVELSAINNMHAEIDGLLRETKPSFAKALLGPALRSTLRCDELSACSTAAEARASPITSPDTATSWLIAGSANDVLVPPSQALEMASKIAARGGHAELHIVAGSGHAFQLGSVLDQMIVNFISS